MDSTPVDQQNPHRDQNESDDDSFEDDDENVIENMEWDNAWVYGANFRRPTVSSSLRTIATLPTIKEEKEWESTGEGAAFLTFATGQVHFLTHKADIHSPSNQSEEDEDLPAFPQAEEIDTINDLPLPNPPTELELEELKAGCSVSKAYQITYL